VEISIMTPRIFNIFFIFLASQIIVNL